MSATSTTLVPQRQPWFLNGVESGAPEKPVCSGEVDGADEDDNERTMLHQCCEIKKHGVLRRAVCQCRSPVVIHRKGRRRESGESGV